MDFGLFSRGPFPSRLAEETGADQEDTQKREDIGITTESIEAIKKQQEGLYAYERPDCFRKDSLCGDP
ncbi:hypothetical protein [Butyrivibrio sp. FCS014]|uniref:hypothetical protein n=1 Tax=Butyrivibrio sp. FCS014 TaxID=1408304 RepID=UPI0012DEECF1|nr:hypothetical protein [Butyrivibrio sp. FCS014]